LPRGSDGTYSLPNGTLVNSGDTVLPSQHNPAFNDVAQALTNSLDRNGSGGMRAPLDMGSYPIQNLSPGTNPTDAATVSQASAGTVPVGTLLDYAGNTAPSGYLLCYGQAISRTTYADLFAILSTTWGIGDGSTTFNVPDFRGRVAAGKDDMGGTTAGRISNIPSTTLGGVGGLKDHTLVTGEMPAHAHGINDPGHTHGYTTVSAIGGIDNGSSFGQYAANTSSAQTGISLQNTGGGGAHNNVQPTAIVNKIIKATN